MKDMQNDWSKYGILDKMKNNSSKHDILNNRNIFCKNNTYIM